MPSVYLDHAATTPLDDAVLDAMLPYLREHYGNASSVHALGRRARFAVEDARERVAALLGAEPGEIVFTSGGTEADNAALRGVLTSPDRRGPGLVTSAVEHEAVLRPAEALEVAGHPVTILTPQPSGAVTAAQVADAITDATGLVSLMAVNNELGTRNPIRDIAAVCHAHGVAFHTDAVQAAGLYDLDVNELGVDLLSLSAHKVYGPKGAGVLYVRAGTPFAPLMLGGSQERKRRGGTENVAAVVGLAAAFERAQASAEAERTRLRGLQTRLADAIRARFPDVRFNTPLADEADTAPHILNVSFSPTEGRVVDGEMLLLGLDLAGVHASSGSACTSGAVEPSHVLRALDVPRATANATVRLSLGRSTTEADVDFAADQLAVVVGRMGGAG
ncbi:MAG: cysteine desulfurase family protein [Rhodothermales bacterium]